jgi:hypothetical protein
LTEFPPLFDRRSQQFYAQRTVAVPSDGVRILDGLAVTAQPPRSRDRGAQTGDLPTLPPLLAHKRRARQHLRENRVTNAAPRRGPSKELLLRAAGRDSNLGSNRAGLLRLLHLLGDESRFSS